MSWKITQPWRKEKSLLMIFERTESEEGGEEIPSVDTETDLSLGDYLTEDDIPDISYGK